jgi:hypothetical protein
MAEQVDTLSKYGQSFQAKVISALLTDVRMMDTLCEIIDKKFFESDANKWIVQEIKIITMSIRKNLHWTYSKGKYQS